MNQLIRVFYATNRELLNGNAPNFGNEFHDGSPHNLRFGWADVMPRDNEDYEVQSVHLAKDPSMERAGIPQDTSEEPIDGSRGTFEKLRTELEANKCDVLCFIHGYATDFKTALARTAEISDKYSTESKPLIGFVFSWPSNGRLIPFIDYYDDRSDAKESGFAIARTFKLLIDFLASLDRDHYCDQSIHLMAHSMGNWALVQALDDIKEQFANPPPRIFDKCFLMAADVDNDAFEKGKRLASLPGMCKAVMVYFSADDIVLMLSDLTKFNPDRLGATGPRTRDGLDCRISMIDSHLVDQPDRISEESGKRNDISAHQYYRLRKEVIEDIQQVLSGAATIKGRKYQHEYGSYRIIPYPER